MRKTSIIIIIVAVAIIIGWDILAYIFGENATFSVIMTDWSRYTPIVSMLWGVLMGHWFWPARGSND